MKELIRKALSPAEIADIKIDATSREATCYILPEEKMKAI